MAPLLRHLGSWPVRGAAFALCLASPGIAQDLDCTNPVTQVEMTGCASRAAEAADKQLNETWQRAIAAARERDEADPGYEPSSEEILRDAQRSWITFRDQACSAEATIARGGTMASQLFLMCLERLTQRRTEDLHLFTETN
ncbi:lysozyme inhibitor LprI family protein [uncultured Roseobacter sp.]|uniref:lysozyme inhibitor LprI family protein n=1 Tax=uncultured Roseobacter sp. TaxID=114847 RepID=UPI00260EF56B|nr:lysozyme inhibitor LprI family protein [uncultured Roseobacter sp.]